MAIRKLTPADLKEVMTLRQVAEYLQLTSDTIYKYASKGEMPAFKLGNRWRFKRSLVDQWIEEKSSLYALTQSTEKLKAEILDRCKP